jgi:hypothetical protein
MRNGGSEVFTRIKKVQNGCHYIDEMLKVDNFVGFKLDPTFGIPVLVYGTSWLGVFCTIGSQATRLGEGRLPGWLSPWQASYVEVPTITLSLFLHVIDSILC